MRKTKSEPDVVSGMIAGLFAGIFASFIMEQFQALWAKAGAEITGKEAAKGKSATVKAADAIAQKLAGHNVPEAKQEFAGEAVHYAMGAASGAIYGAVTELAPAAALGEGLGFGAAVFLAADEVSIPLLGLSKAPREIPLTTHLYALVSHLVYGWTTELVRAAVRRAIR